MSLVNLSEILAAARAGGYAVPAFNDVNGLYARSLIRAAEDAKSPLIIMVAEVHFQFVDLDEISPYLVHICNRAKVPVALMLDHGASFASVMKAIRNGFTAVMFDGSCLPYEENVARTKAVVELAHTVGVTVEGELGHVTGHEGGAKGELPASTQLLTDPGQAAEFISLTGVDCLAVSIGTQHGFYAEEVSLDFPRLRRISNAVSIPLAIHGGSGLSKEDFRRLVVSGATKLNYYTNMAASAGRAARDAFRTRQELWHLPEMMQKVEEVVRMEAASVMSVLGCVGRLP